MASHAAVGVHDDLAAGQTGVAHRPADHESPRGVDVILGVRVQQTARNHRLDHVSQDFRAQLIIPDRLGVLGGDDHRIHTERLSVLIVFNRNLGFSVGTKVRAGSVLANFRKSLGELVGQQDRGGHQFGIFVYGETEHHALVTSAAGIHTHCDVARLLVNAGNHGAGIAIETVQCVVVPDGLNYAAY